MAKKKSAKKTSKKAAKSKKARKKAPPLHLQTGPDSKKLKVKKSQKDKVTFKSTDFEYEVTFYLGPKGRNWPFLGGGDKGDSFTVQAKRSRTFTVDPSADNGQYSYTVVQMGGPRPEPMIDVDS